MRLLLAQLYWYDVGGILSLDRPGNSKRICRIRINPDLKICFEFLGRSNDKILLRNTNKVAQEADASGGIIFMS